MSGFVTRRLGRIKKNKTLGSILKTARSKANLTLEQAEQLTKVRLKYLLALERGSYQQLPADAYNVGFVRLYAEALNLDVEKIISLYREERSRHRLYYSDDRKLSPLKMADWHFLITPKIITVSLSLLVFGGLATYIGLELKKFTSPPSLEISSVPEEFISQTGSINISGKAEGGAVVKINNEPIFTDANGNFSQEVRLSLGINNVVVSALSRADRETRKVLKILYNQTDLARNQL